MNTKLLGVITASAAFFSIVAMSGAANAASLSSKASTDYALTDEDPATLSIQKFDSNLGQLNSVTVDFTSDFLRSGTLTNPGKRDLLLTVTASGTANLLLNNQSLFSLPDPTTKSSYTIAPKTQVLLPGLTTTVNQTATYTDLNFLQSFIGTGDLDFLFLANAEASSTALGGGNYKTDISTYAKAAVNVTYNYGQKPTTVPEPSALLGIGLVAGLGLSSQRKRSFSKV